MTRTRASAKQAGARFETTIAAYLRTHIDDRIERRARNGTRDRGDITGLRTPHGHRLVLEVKNHARIDLAGWWRETEVEVGNDDALAGAIVHKRHGVAAPGQQWVTLTVDHLIAILTGQQP